VFCSKLWFLHSISEKTGFSLYIFVNYNNWILTLNLYPRRVMKRDISSLYSRKVCGHLYNKTTRLLLFSLVTKIYANKYVYIRKHHYDLMLLAIHVMRYSILSDSWSDRLLLVCNKPSILIWWLWYTVALIVYNARNYALTLCVINTIRKNISYSAVGNVTKICITWTV